METLPPHPYHQHHAPVLYKILDILSAIKAPSKGYRFIQNYYCTNKALFTDILIPPEEWPCCKFLYRVPQHSSRRLFWGKLIPWNVSLRDIWSVTGSSGAPIPRVHHGSPRTREKKLKRTPSAVRSLGVETGNRTRRNSEGDNNSLSRVVQ